MILTERDLAIIDALNLRVRLLTLAQIANAWWSQSASGRKNAAKRTLLLVGGGLLRSADVLAQPPLLLASPAAAWRPGDEPPEFGPLAWRLQSRWCGQPRQSRVFLASPRAVALWGGRVPGRIKNLCQVTHDLHVGAVYLAYLHRWPAQAADWVGEDLWASEAGRQKIPDALLVDRDGQAYRAVEFGGSYSARRLAAFHDHCRDRGLPYEIW